jgi:hypothetical protein
MIRRFLMHRDVDELAAQFTLSLTLRNACVAFFDDRQTMYRSQIITFSESDEEMVLHGFNERSLGYARVTSVRPAARHERAAVQLCKRHKLGIGVPVSHMSSVYHQMFHAVPTWAAAHQSGVGVNNAVFVPLVFASAGIGRGKPSNPKRWHAWEFSLRAMTNHTATAIETAASDLLSSPCTCFERFHAHTIPFNPCFRGAARLMRDFREAALRNAHTLAHVQAGEDQSAQRLHSRHKERIYHPHNVCTIMPDTCPQAMKMAVPRKIFSLSVAQLGGVLFPMNLNCLSLCSVCPD